jgi:membrane protein DedA with SNARE-associated domain/rhodanese-related sulfurtransferase
MHATLEFLVRHGVLVLFAAVFVAQAGVPLPATPWLLTAGALAGAGKMNALTAVLAAALGSMAAGQIWFHLGRRYGNRLLNVLCRISLEPDSCVRRTQNVFAKYGMKGIVAAKFVSGLSTLAPPLAGSSGVSAPRFFLFDTLGSLLYAGTFILLGVLFSHQLEQVIDALAGLGKSALAVVAVFVALYLGYKYLQRYRLLRELNMTRITVDELHQKQQAGEMLVILDLRPRSELDKNPSLIRGALHMTLEEMQLRQQEIPRDRDIVVYCSCPNEVSAARAALMLQRQGFLRVRPLLGGIDAWQKRSYPLDSPNE